MSDRIASVTAIDTSVIVPGLLFWHKNLSHRNLVGGTTYDSLILASARKGGAQRILTFNRSHFERIATEGIEIVVPAGQGA